MKSRSGSVRHSRATDSFGSERARDLPKKADQSRSRCIARGLFDRPAKAADRAGQVALGARRARSVNRASALSSARPYSGK
jgi:hypothetical protein